MQTKRRLTRTLSLLFAITAAMTTTFGKSPEFYDNSTWERDELFNMRFIEDRNKVQEHMHNVGFSDVTFDTTDGYNLHGLLKTVDQPDYTIIFAGGYCPGYKESMTTLYKHIPDNGNVLFYDARGHGQSKGKLKFAQFWRYGIDDYKDVIAAIECAHKQAPNTPIILYGICAGFFNISHAILHMGPELCKKYNIAGLVADSAWGSFSQVARTGSRAQISGISNCFALAGAKITLFCLYHGLGRPLMWLNESRTKLFGKVHAIQTPTLFIHSRNDTFAEFESAKKLASQMPNAKTWWIDKSKHGLHYLKHKYEYRTRLTGFINHQVVAIRNSL
jgi:pimeloyl-ACP methyl ester carboxylesterase